MHEAIGKEEMTMATSTFERKIVITDEEAIKKLWALMDEDMPKKSLSERPYTAAERERSDKLLELCLSRSRA